MYPVRRTGRPRAKRRQEEAAFQARIIELATLCGWKVWHCYDARRTVPGFPDLVLVRERVLFRELKTDKGRLTQEQKDWIDAINAAENGDAAVWRPRDWEDLILPLLRARRPARPSGS